ncbi:NAC domain-containing protein 89-like [Vitis riparia]|uniref:NAC domain-containing protein 89-like n=1 Tax=Vitis riparia TaxID=96939 RepID=UPI00155AF5D7|nr:NAC domain-containing protein 89-like [Vitis riparia]
MIQSGSFSLPFIRSRKMAVNSKGQQIRAFGNPPVRIVKSSIGGTGEVIGTKKTLVFHEGRGPSAVRTGWIIHEYHADKKFVRDDETYVVCRLKRETGSGFPPQTNLNGMLPNPSSNQQTWLMNMDVDDSSTGTGIHLNPPPNSMTSGADWSHYAINIASDPRNYLPNDMTPDDDLAIDSADSFMTGDQLLTVGTWGIVILAGY